jgi:hypothetical protein
MNPFASPVRLVGVLVLAALPAGIGRPANAPAEKVVYDFEDPVGIKTWIQSAPPGPREPEVKIEQSGDDATAGKHGLKLTFAGGQWPTAATEAVSQDWLAYKTFKADVTAPRACVVGFTLLQEKSARGDGWEAVISRWTTTAFLKPGRNEVVASLLSPNDYAVHAKWGKVVRFEAFMYNPHAGESLVVGNVRLCNDKLPPRKPVRVAIQGTDWSVTGATGGSAEACRELGRNLAHVWNRPAAVSLDEVEAEFRAKHAELKKRHPRAVIAVLRDGEPGYDPASPGKAFAGWKDAYWSSHGPDTAFAERARNRGRDASHEVFMRHRSPLMRVDLASIPPGSNVLAAQLVIVRTSDKVLDDHDPGKRPTMWVVEPCNRPWDEYEVNAFQYAKDRFWKDVGGHHTGDADPDFLPVFLAFGPGRPGRVNTWDFTQAVRFWTTGTNANHGFMLHGDSADYMRAHTREAAAVTDRPAVYVSYVPG